MNLIKKIKKNYEFKHSLVYVNYELVRGNYRQTFTKHITRDKAKTLLLDYCLQGYKVSCKVY